MDKRRPIQADVRATTDPGDETSLAADRFREALARWAATVTIVAVRDEDGDVHATTVTSFAPVSAEPPLVVLSLSPHAQALPFLELDGRVGVSLLGEDQARWASILADSLPVASPPWENGDPPVVVGAVARLACTVRAVHPADGGSRVVLCRVDDVALGDDDRPLLYWQRRYRTLAED